MQSGRGDAGDRDREMEKEGNDKQQREEGVMWQACSAQRLPHKGQRQHRGAVSHEETEQGGHVHSHAGAGGKGNQHFKKVQWNWNEGMF